MGWGNNSPARPSARNHFAVFKRAGMLCAVHTLCILCFYLKSFISGVYKPMTSLDHPKNDYTTVAKVFYCKLLVRAYSLQVLKHMRPEWTVNFCFQLSGNFFEKSDFYITKVMLYCQVIFTWHVLRSKFWPSAKVAITDTWSWFHGTLQQNVLFYFSVTGYDRDLSEFLIGFKRMTIRQHFISRRDQQSSWLCHVNYLLQANKICREFYLNLHRLSLKKNVLYKDIITLKVFRIKFVEIWEPLVLFWLTVRGKIVRRQD